MLISPVGAADVALYVGAGTWEVERDYALPAILDWMGLTHETLTPAQIQSGLLLDEQNQPRFKVLMVPGGWAADYQASLGGAPIRAYVQAGGNYLGFCAGAYSASDCTDWEGTTYEYHWDLFDGTSVGPMPWNPWEPPAPNVLGTADLDLSSWIFSGAELPAELRITLAGGQSFEIHPDSRQSETFEIHATHGEDGSPSIVSVRYPDATGGRVLLCAYHPSVLSDDKGNFDRDPADYGQNVSPDPDGCAPDWQLARSLIRAVTDDMLPATAPMPHSDYSPFASCDEGPEVSISADCKCLFDADWDGDVDLLDFADFQRGFESYQPPTSPVSDSKPTH